MKSRQSISQNTSQRLTLHTGLLTSIRLLRTDAAGLSHYLEEAATDNPHLVVERRGHAEWLPRWVDAFRRMGPGAGDAEIDNIVGAGPSLMAHVMDAIEAMALSPRDKAIAEVLADALEPSGWIGRPLPDIAAEARASLPETERVLSRLQRIEPIGLFARSLAECLALQARDAGVLDATLTAILGKLDLLAQGDFGRLARSIGVSEAEVASRLRVIRSFDPKPGAQFSAFAAPSREPDLVVQQGRDGWTVGLNRSALPDLRLADMAKGTPGQRTEARNLIKMVEGRNASMLKVAGAILKHQAAALDRGPQMLAPMTMSDIAAEVGLAQSTVSRIVAGTSVDTPHGTWWLRALFSQAKSAGGQSSAALRERLSRLVGSEDATRPLSDAAISAALSSPGFDVARRTVAKYRGMLGIPPAHRRRKERASS